MATEKVPGSARGKIARLSAPPQLLVRPTPRPDEHGLGYQLRLAHVNGLANPSWLAHSIASADLPKGLARARWCPFCIGEAEAYWRQSWQAGPGICIRHQCWLVDVCPHCTRATTWRRVRLRSCSCKHDLSETTAAVISPEIAAFLPNQPVGDGRDIWWRQLNLERRWRLARFLGALATYGLHNKPLKKASQATIVMEKAMVTAGAAILQGGEAGFHVLLDRIRVAPTKKVTVQLLREAYPGLIFKVRSRLPKFECENLLSQIRSYVQKKSASRVALTWRDAEVAATKSARDCAREFKIRPDRVLTLIADHGISPKVRQTKTGRTMLALGAAELAQVQQSVSTSLCQRRASKLFGISPQRQCELVKVGLIRKVGTCIDGPSMAQLVDDIVQRAQEGPPEHSNDMLAFAEALRTLVPVPLTVQFIQALLDKQIKIFYVTQSVNSFRDLVISRTQTKTVLAGEQHKGASLLSIPEATTHLGLKQEVVYHLIRKKLIKSVPRRIGRRAARYVSRQEIERFQQKTEPLVTAAGRAGIPFQGALKWASVQGLRLVSGPSVDGGRQYFVSKVES